MRSRHPKGTFIKCTRAWGADLDEPAWYVIEFDDDMPAVMLKGCFRPDRPLTRFARVDCNGSHTTKPNDPVALDEAVPVHMLPDDVLAAYIEWKLLGEPYVSCDDA